MTDNEMNDPRELADKVYEAGMKPDDVAAALEKMGDRRAEFLSRLAVRSAAGALEDEAVSLASTDVVGNDDLAFSALRALYDQKKIDGQAGTTAKDLSSPKVWAAAKSSFGNDTSFVIKLAGRNVSTPTVTFIRYVADALGVALDQVRQHFSGSLPRGLVGAEFKASGKPDVGAVEDFAAAVNAAKVPDALKARWLEE